MATPDAELKVRIEAELGNFANTLKKGEKDLASFGARVDAGLKRSAQQAAQTGAALAGGYTKGATQAAFATTNLSRVLQDAPFGFIGIQNNLNPLLESFGQLRKETGSNAGALKALISSLAGPAGLGLALAAVSAGLLLYQEYQRKANKETVVAADANKELAESIKSITEVQAEGRKNASAELSSLQSLYNATQNLSIPQTERLKIAKELIEKYPTYLKGMSAEGILAGQAAAQYNVLTNAILAKGIVQAAEENRQKLINQQLNLSIDKAREAGKLEKALADQRAGRIEKAGQVSGFFSSTEFDPVPDNAVQRAQKNLKTIDDSLKQNRNAVTELDTVTQGLIKTYGSFVIVDPEKTKESVKNVKTVADIFKALNIDLKQAEASVGGTFGDKAKERVSAFAKAIDELIAIGVKPTDGIIKGLQEKLLGAQLPNVAAASEKFAGVVVSNVQKGFENAGGVLPKELTNGTAARALTSPFQQLNDYIGVELFPKLQSGFENFFNDILEKGTFSFGALGSAILKTFTSVLASEATRGILSLLNPAQTTLQKGGKGLFGLVASVIGTGSKAAPLAGIAASTGGFLGTGAGLGAAATGTAATGGLLLPILGGLAAGGLIASLFKKKKVEPQPSFSTSSNFTTSPVSNSGFDYGRVVFEISGVNLIGVLNRAGAKLQRFGP